MKKWVNAYWPSYGPSLLLVLRGSLAAALSWQVTLLLFGPPGASLAPVSAIIVMQPTTWQTLRRSLERLVGVIIGVSLATLVAHLIGLNFWTLLVVGLCAYGAGLLVQQRGAYLASQIPISAVLALLVGGAAGGYPIQRTLGAIIGGLIGTSLSLLLTPHDPWLALRGALLTDMRRMVDELSEL